MSLKMQPLAYGSKHLSFKWQFARVPFGQGSKLNCKNITYKTRVLDRFDLSIGDRKKNKPSEKVRSYQQGILSVIKRLLCTQYLPIYLMHLSYLFSELIENLFIFDFYKPQRRVSYFFLPVTLIIRTGQQTRLFCTAI